MSPNEHHQKHLILHPANLPPTKPHKQQTPPLKLSHLSHPQPSPNPIHHPNSSEQKPQIHSPKSPAPHPPRTNLIHTEKKVQSTPPHHPSQPKKKRKETKPIPPIPKQHTSPSPSPPTPHPPSLRSLHPHPQPPSPPPHLKSRDPDTPLSMSKNPTTKHTSLIFHHLTPPSPNFLTPQITTNNSRWRVTLENNVRIPRISVT